MLIDYEALSRADRRALAGLHDSKQMKPEHREDLYPAVLRAASRVSVVVGGARGREERGRHGSNNTTHAPAPQPQGPPGDGTSAAIAAASVIAKVTRDRYMHGAAGEHPGWGFEEHVGYSTPEHRAAIERLGISPLHRRSFQSVAYSQLELAS